MTPGSVRTANRWTTRVVPLLLTGCVGYATYVVVKHVCLDYYRSFRRQPRVATTFLVPYFAFLVFMVVCYARVFVFTLWNPDIVPLGPQAEERLKEEGRRSRQRLRSQEGDIEAQRYTPGPDSNPDSPGLEQFYSKDVFVCETDGRPRWCSSCCNWKPDRVYHNREIDRCVKKLDHFCPWVGGIVSQSCFKFFVQFNAYTSLYCAVVLAATVLCLKEKLDAGMPADGQLIALIVIAGFFGLFTCGMAWTSSRFVLTNRTSVEVVKSKNLVHQLAVLVPRGTPATIEYGVITYPLPIVADRTSSHLSGQTMGTESSPLSRDELATRTFAILKTGMGENPWDLGRYRNWKSVMGDHALDWFLPLRQSPCVDAESNESFYEMGPLCNRLRSKYKLPDISDDDKSRNAREVLEMREIGRRRNNA